MDDHKDHKEYEAPSILDVEDLEKVSGGGCGTGGTIIVQKSETGEDETL